jgi:hypothetical protein
MTASSRVSIRRNRLPLQNFFVLVIMGFLQPRIPLAARAAKIRIAYEMSNCVKSM